MVRIRFRRVGARGQPSYRIVAADKESPRDGRFLEVLGSYNPRTNPSTIHVDEARLFHWMSNGAQPSDSVVQTLQSRGTWERWERFKGGEALETLIQEAEAAIPDVDPRTRRDDLISQGSTKRRRHPEADEMPEAEAKVEAAESEAAEPAESAEAETVEPEAVEPAEAEAAEAEVDEGETESAEPEVKSAESSVEGDDVVEDEPEADADAESAETEAEEEAKSEADAEADDAEPSTDPQGGE